nr:hypothetical protein [Tanacetum cinerariifolium]
MNKECDLENTPVNDRYAKGMHTVPPPMTGNCISSGPDVEIDYSQFTYGPKQTSAGESDSKPVEFASSDSDSSVETTTSMPAPVKDTLKVVSEPKVWTDAPIIEEYESDSDDDLVSHGNVKETGTPNHCPKVKRQDRHSHTRNGLSYARKSCFVCGSFSHLIRDCEFHEKRMAKQAALTKSKEKVTGQQAHGPVWNNVKRVNHQNKFVPSVLLTKTGKIPVNAARQNFSRHAALTNKIEKLEDGVHKLEEENKILKEKSFKSTNIDTATPVEDKEESFKQERMIADMDEDVEVNLEETQAKAYNLDLQLSEKVLSMQDIDEEEPAEVEEVLEVVTAAKLMTEVVTTTEPTITAAQVPKASALKRRRGVLIQDPEETAASVIIHIEVKPKDKGKGILIKEPKPLKRQAQIK